MRLAFVTGNPGKARELAAALAPHGVEVVQDTRGYPEVQAGTLDEVAAFGADHLLAHGLRPPFVLEDAGLFVEALRGFPGVYSRHALDTLGCDGLLRLLRDRPAAERGATFRSLLLYVDPAGRRHAFAGACSGSIAAEARGGQGFGFDPVFIPQGETRTFAEMAEREKEAVSHRGKAARSLAAHLEKAAKR